MKNLRLIFHVFLSHQIEERRITNSIPANVCRKCKKVYYHGPCICVVEEMERMAKMSDKFPNRKPYSHEICTQEELDFLINWLNVLFRCDSDIRGKVNSYSIAFTGKFVAVDQSGVIQICKVEK